jgi:hypothetical protein
VGRRSRRIALTAVIVVVAVIGVSLTTLGVAAAQPRTQISQADAIADARKVLPNSGSGYEVLKTELESNSTHFNFTNANGSGGFGEDGVQECLIVPPFPIRFGCRPYPVWVIELSGPSCQATIAINARSGRFGGAGTDGCDIVPEPRPPPMMFVAEWE